MNMFLSENERQYERNGKGGHGEKGPWPAEGRLLKHLVVLPEQQVDVEIKREGLGIRVDEIHTVK